MYSELFEKDAKSISLADLHPDVVKCATEFVIDLKPRSVSSGVTYKLFLDSNKDDVKYVERYKQLRYIMTSHRVGEQEYLAVYSLKNGWVVSTEINTAKQITLKITERYADEVNDPSLAEDWLGDEPYRSRRMAVASLVKYLTEQFNSGAEQADIAIYNTNSGNKITMTAKNEHGQDCRVEYAAFAITHNDFADVNKLTIPRGFRVSDVTLGEIFPRRNGVRCTVYLYPVR